MNVVEFKIGVWYEGTANGSDGESDFQYFPSIRIIRRTDSTVWCVSEYDSTIIYRRKVSKVRILTGPDKGKSVERIAIRDLDNAVFYATHRSL